MKIIFLSLITIAFFSILSCQAETEGFQQSRGILTSPAPRDSIEPTALLEPSSSRPLSQEPITSTPTTIALSEAPPTPAPSQTGVSFVYMTDEEYEAWQALQPTHLPLPKDVLGCQEWYKKYSDATPGPTCMDYTGQVFDQDGRAIPGAIVEIYNAKDYEKIITDSEGKYLAQYIKNPPNYLKASKPGYASRFIRSRPRSNNYFYLDRNIDFGGTSQYSSYPEAFLDIRPEVIALKSHHNYGGPQDSNLTPAYTVTFSKPVNKSDVENKFTYHTWADWKPNVDSKWFYQESGEYPLQTTLLVSWKLDQPGSADSALVEPSALEFEWNQSADEVIVRFKPGYQLPGNSSSTENNLINISHQLQVVPAFTRFGHNDRGIRDLQGNVRTEKHFYLASELLNCLDKCPANMTILQDQQPVMPVQHLETPSEQRLRPGDSQRPRLVSLEAIDTTLRLLFSEIMAVRTRPALIAGGMIDRRPPGLPGSETRAPAEYPGNLGNVTGHKTAANYQLRILSQGQEKLKATWKALGGSAHYDEADETYHSVRLRPPRNTTAQAVSGFYPAHSSAWTGAVAAGWGQGSSPSESWTLRWRGVNRQGQLGPVREINVPGHELRTLSEWAAQVQLALAASDNTSQWQVQGSADGKHLQLRFSSDNWIGWRLESLSSSSAAFPDEMLTPAKTWAANQDWAWWQPGDSLEIEVLQPILDPAGNPIADDGKKASLPSVP